jgi:hypothetical protein
VLGATPQAQPRRCGHQSHTASILCSGSPCRARSAGPSAGGGTTVLHRHGTNTTDEKLKIDDSKTVVACVFFQSAICNRQFPTRRLSFADAVVMQTVRSYRTLECPVTLNSNDTFMFPSSLYLFVSAPLRLPVSRVLKAALSRPGSGAKAVFHRLLSDGPATRSASRRPHSWCAWHARSPSERP